MSKICQFSNQAYIVKSKIMYSIKNYNNLTNMNNQKIYILLILIH